MHVAFKLDHVLGFEWQGEDKARQQTLVSREDGERANERHVLQRAFPRRLRQSFIDDKSSSRSSSIIPSGHEPLCPV